MYRTKIRNKITKEVRLTKKEIDGLMRDLRARQDIEEAEKQMGIGVYIQAQKIIKAARRSAEGLAVPTEQAKLRIQADNEALKLIHDAGLPSAKPERSVTVNWHSVVMQLANNRITGGRKLTPEQEATFRQMARQIKWEKVPPETVDRLEQITDPSGLEFAYRYLVTTYPGEEALPPQ